MPAAVDSRSSMAPMSLSSSGSFSFKTTAAVVCLENTETQPCVIIGIVEQAERGIRRVTHFPDAALGTLRVPLQTAAAVTAARPRRYRLVARTLSKQSLQ